MTATEATDQIDQATYQAQFFRPKETWRDAWIACDGIRVNYRLGWENGTAILCRVLKTLGRPDGSFAAAEVGAHPAYALVHRYTTLTMHDLAAKDIGSNRVSLKIFDDLRQIAQGAAWSSIAQQHDILGRGFVAVTGDTASLTDLGRAAILDFETAQERNVPSVVLSTLQREGFEIVATDPAKWDTLHGKTQKLMIACGWVALENKKPVLTPLGQDIYKHVVLAKTEEVAAEPAAAPPASDNKFIYFNIGKTAVRVNPAHRKAFDVISQTPTEWEAAVHRATRAYLTEVKWVVVRNGVPTLTELGQRVADTAAARLRAA